MQATRYLWSLEQGNLIRIDNGSQIFNKSEQNMLQVDGYVGGKEHLVAGLIRR